MHEFRVFMQAQLAENNPTREGIREMRGHLQALEETHNQLRNALYRESSNAGRSSGVGSRQGWGGNMGSRPGGSGGSRGSHNNRGGGNRSSRGGYF